MADEFRETVADLGIADRVEIVVADGFDAYAEAWRVSQIARQDAKP